MKPIQMVDLNKQHSRIRKELDTAISKVIDHGQFIQGPEVKEFENKLASWWGTQNVISCGNGTDALYLAVLALDLPKNSEIIVPSFNYVSAAEVVLRAGHKPVFADVNPYTFNIDKEAISNQLSPNTRAIIVVHLFGLCAPMEDIMDLARKNDLFVIEDNAQSLGAEITLGKFKGHKAGTIGHIGTTSFFPTKILSCFGDGGAVCTSNPGLANRVRMLANHGQERKYFYDVPGINSRLDSIQAAVLSVKMNHLDAYIQCRQLAAKQYDLFLSDLKECNTPIKASYSTHVYHQYTLRVFNNKRDSLRQYLQDHQVPSMIYYPLPLHLQKAFSKDRINDSLANAEQISREVLSLPMHTELHENQIEQICSQIIEFFKSNL